MWYSYVRSPIKIFIDNFAAEPSAKAAATIYARVSFIFTTYIIAWNCFFSFGRTLLDILINDPLDGFILLAK